MIQLYLNIKIEQISGLPCPWVSEPFASNDYTEPWLGNTPKPLEPRIVRPHNLFYFQVVESRTQSYSGTQHSNVNPILTLTKGHSIQKV